MTCNITRSYTNNANLHTPLFVQLLLDNTRSKDLHMKNAQYFTISIRRLTKPATANDNRVLEGTAMLGGRCQMLEVPHNWSWGLRRSLVAKRTQELSAGLLLSASKLDASSLLSAVRFN